MFSKPFFKLNKTTDERYTVFKLCKSYRLNWGNHPHHKQGGVSVIGTKKCFVSKRSDARIVVLAVVINNEGFLKYSNIFEGNIADCKTLGSEIDTFGCAARQKH